MISFNEIGRGIQLRIDNNPYEIIEANHVFKGRGQSVIQAKIKNLKDGTILSRAFRPSETFKEVEIEKRKAKFIYKNKGNCFFSEENNPKNRFNLLEDKIGNAVKFIKEGQIIDTIIFEDEIINIVVPVKVSLKVIEAPPGIKGDRVQAGNKIVVVETGAEISVPLFIKENDIIEINTETGEYSKRIQ